VLGSAGAVLAAAVAAYHVLVGPFEKVEPRIIRLEAPIRMIGVSMRTSMRSIYKDASRLGQEYRRAGELDLVKNKKEPWEFVAISKDFEGQESWEYLMGDVVNSLDVVPHGMKPFEIPAATYAVFPIRPKSKFAWGIAIGLTKKYVFTEWFPACPYEHDGSALGDFEYHDRRSLGRRPEIDLYVPVKLKTEA
jgi:AraC family transcriptional regulator